MIETGSDKPIEKSSQEILSREYPQQVIERWKAGGKRWRELDAQLTMLGIRNDLTDSSRDALRSVFVGVKPAVFLESGDSLARIRPILEAAGVALTRGRKFIDDNYIYDPTHVEKILRDNPDIFPESSAPSAKMVMQGLTRNSRGQNSRERGLVLGFPKAAVDAFESYKGVGALGGEYFYDVLNKEDRAMFDSIFADLNSKYSAQEKSTWFREKLKEYGPRAGITPERMAEIEPLINQETSWQGFGAHGFVWCDYTDSKESAEKEQQIKDAFLVAGLA